MAQRISIPNKPNNTYLAKICDYYTSLSNTGAKGLSLGNTSKPLHRYIKKLLSITKNFVANFCRITFEINGTCNASHSGTAEAIPVKNHLLNIHCLSQRKWASKERIWRRTMTRRLRKSRKHQSR